MSQEQSQSLDGPVSMIGDSWRKHKQPFDELAVAPPAPEDRANCQVRFKFNHSFEVVTSVHLRKYPTELEPLCLGTQQISTFVDAEGRSLSRLLIAPLD